MKFKLLRLTAGLVLAVACLQLGSTARAQSCATVTNGLVAWWKAEHNAMDSVGTNHGHPLEGVGYAEGRVARAFSLEPVSKLSLGIE